MKTSRIMDFPIAFIDNFFREICYLTENLFLQETIPYLEILHLNLRSYLINIHRKNVSLVSNKS